MINNIKEINGIKIVWIATILELAIILHASKECGHKRKTNEYVVKNNFRLFKEFE